MIIELILPAHNEAKSIGRTIEAFFAATRFRSYQLHILIAEDGSADETRTVVEQLRVGYSQRLRITPSSERKGYSKAMIEAIPATSADVVAFCDADGQFDPDELEKLIADLRHGTVVAGLRSP